MNSKTSTALEMRTEQRERWLLCLFDFGSVSFTIPPPKGKKEKRKTIQPGLSITTATGQQEIACFAFLDVTDVARLFLACGTLPSEAGPVSTT